MFLARILRSTDGEPEHQLVQEAFTEPDSGNEFDDEWSELNPAHVSDGTVSDWEAGASVDVPAIGESLDFIHHEVTVHQRAKPSTG